MNVAIISPEFPPYTNWGGLATFNNNLSLLLSRMKHQVYVITFDGVGNQRKVMKKNGINIVYIQFKSWNKFANFLYYKFPGGIFKIIINRFFPMLMFTIDWNTFSFLEFKKLHKEINFDVIHTPAYHAPSLFINYFFKNIPHYLHAQGPQELLNMYEVRSLDKFLKSRVENFFMNIFSDKVVACSINVQNKIITSFPELHEKMVHIPNFIDITLYKNNLSINKDNIVFFGRLDYRKGVDILLKSFIEIAKTSKNLKLYLIGQKGDDFSYEGKYINFDSLLTSFKVPRNIKERIFIFPRIDDHRALIELLKKIKGIAVFPSRYEPFGFVTVEAMALGYLVIVSNQGGGREIVNDGVNGLIITPNQRSLFSALNRASQLSMEEVIKISKNGYQTVNSRYSFRAVEKLIQNKLYKNIT
jgi:glycosyltransferase involved in cell wall biosynthesis